MWRLPEWHLPRRRHIKTYEDERVGARIIATRVEVAMDRVDATLQRYEGLRAVPNRDARED